MPYGAADQSNALTYDYQGQRVSMTPGFDVRTLPPGVHNATFGGRQGQMEYYRPNDEMLRSNPGHAGAIRFSPSRGQLPIQQSDWNPWGGQENLPWGTRQVKYSVRSLPGGSPTPMGYTRGNLPGFATGGRPASMGALAADQLRYLQQMGDG